MADHIHPGNESRSAQLDQPGLEAAPIRYSTLPIPYDPTEKSAWTSRQSNPGSPAAPVEKRRVLGLTVPVFWSLVTALVVILVGGIAGGVAGGLASQKANNSSVAVPSPSGTAAVVSQPIPTTSEAGSGSSSGSRSPASTATSSAYRSPPTGVRPAPTDDGCPTINQTSYTPTDANGDSVRAGSASPQTFRQLCEVNYPSGAEYGNPNLYDIVKVYVPTFRDCMDLCAAYNQGYSGNLALGNVASGGYCRSVAMIKLPGEYCYLKNGTGETSKMDTQGHAQDFISAVVISGLPGR
ncbi:hypothetical protein LY78DRAFT_614936 [Colletotrichum sublineola]|nr:hypothetical protein LY78DRAFT_614936 [Colletotrichum sublineola]